MTPRKKTKKRRKAIKYKVITIRITSRQYKSLSNFSKSRRTTPNKIIKKAIKPLMSNYTGLEVNKAPVKVNQLELFNLE
ncbi:MAG: hypothetical protein M0P58_03320 [Bacteroidales bacterium]|jgi:hypothetical protein|nr:hypothetical protein [Bacteroidales bacterium]